MSTNLTLILLVITLIGAIIVLGRRSGRAEAEDQALKAGKKMEEKAVDELTKAPADPAAVADWLRRGGRGS